MKQFGKGEVFSHDDGSMTYLPAENFLGIQSSPFTSPDWIFSAAHEAARTVSRTIEDNASATGITVSAATPGHAHVSLSEDFSYNGVLSHDDSFMAPALRGLFG